MHLATVSSPHCSAYIALRWLESRDCRFWKRPVLALQPAMLLNPSVVQAQPSTCPYTAHMIRWPLELHSTKLLTIVHGCTAALAGWPCCAPLRHSYENVATARVGALSNCCFWRIYLLAASVRGATPPHASRARPGVAAGVMCLAGACVARVPCRKVAF